MSPKKRKTTPAERSAETTPQSVFVLTLESINHRRNHHPEVKVVGVYSNKSAAVKASRTIETCHGFFDSAISEIFEYSHKDNRANPPDNGVLVQLGFEEVGEGDIVRLLIGKFPVLDE